MIEAASQDAGANRDQGGKVRQGQSHDQRGEATAYTAALGAAITTIRAHSHQAEAKAEQLCKKQVLLDPET